MRVPGNPVHNLEMIYCSTSRQCTECDSSSSEEEDHNIDPNDKTSLLESRQKRNIKEPSKFTPGKDVSTYELIYKYRPYLQAKYFRSISIYLGFKRIVLEIECE